MELYIQNLGKVSVTPEGEHNINKSYKRLSLVSITEGYKLHSYISKKKVPVGIPVINSIYWMPLGLDIVDEAIVIINAILEYDSIYRLDKTPTEIQEYVNSKRQVIVYCDNKYFHIHSITESSIRFSCFSQNIIHTLLTNYFYGADTMWYLHTQSVNNTDYGVSATTQSSSEYVALFDEDRRIYKSISTNGDITVSANSYNSSDNKLIIKNTSAEEIKIIIEPCAFKNRVVTTIQPKEDIIVGPDEYCELTFVITQYNAIITVNNHLIETIL